MSALTIDARNTAQIVITIIACSFLCCAAQGKDRTWYKYENRHFVAYSDDSEKQVRGFLTELEYFRSAVLQVSNIPGIENAAKTNVIIFNSTRDFQKLVGSTRIAGFVSNKPGVPYMVLSARSQTQVTKVVLRHEFTHVLLSSRTKPYPTWFNEGFAELMAAIVFGNKYADFTVGDFSGRMISDTRFTPWRDIVAEDFSPHSLTSMSRISNAYLQCWSLAHYFMLGNDFQNTAKLQKYLTLRDLGDDSVEAFESIIGTTAEEFGENLWRDYTMPVVAYKFRQTDTDFEFSRNAIGQDEVLGITKHFRGIFDEPD